MKVEVLLQPNTAVRGEKMLRALIAAAPAAGVEVDVTRKWRRSAPVLMTYGLGHVERRPWQDAHKRAGRRLVGWDLGYWNRDVPLDFAMRLTIDDDHPHRRIVPMPGARWAAAGIALRDDADPDGPIVLVGLGRKQRVMMRLHGQRWERDTAERLRHRFPARRVVYRPKRPERLAGFPTAEGAIEDVLRGASLVVCHHSNVAVDACIAGVPVECEDGAALALYRGNPNPSPAQRLAFLRSLAWWQWTPAEALAAWRFIREQLGE